MHIWPIKFVMVVGLLFFLVQTLLNALEKFKRLKSPEEKAESISSDDFL
jgi:hypothetical protein